MAEGINKKEAAVFEEVGVETDEEARTSLRDYSNLLSSNKQRR